MIRAILIDDDPQNTALLRSMLEQHAAEIDIAGTASSVESGIECILKLQPDLVFLDAELGDGTGFDLLQKIPRRQFQVVFVTAYEAYALEAFHFSAIDYLLKPVSPSRLADTIARAMENNQQQNLSLKLDTLLSNAAEPVLKKRKIVLKTLERIYALGCRDIIRFESDGSYTTVYLADNQKVVVSKLIKEFDTMLASCGFLRLHHSHLVNSEYIHYFEKSESVVVLKDQSQIPVSTRKRDLLLDFFS